MADGDETEGKAAGAEAGGDEDRIETYVLAQEQWPEVYAQLLADIERGAMNVIKDWNKAEFEETIKLMDAALANRYFVPLMLTLLFNMSGVNPEFADSMTRQLLWQRVHQAVEEAHEQARPSDSGPRKHADS